MGPLEGQAMKPVDVYRRPRQVEWYPRVPYTSKRQTEKQSNTV